MPETYAESLFTKLKDKKIEVYTGSSGKDREYADFTVTYKEVIRGIFVEAVGDLMILEVTDASGNTNKVYVNGWSVVSVMEPRNKMSTFDIYVDEAEKQAK